MQHPNYKGYQNKYIPYCKNIGDYEPYDFDPDAYPGESGQQSKLKQYLGELEPYVCHLREAARQRELHYERQILGRGRLEDERHRYFRIQFTLIADLAAEKLCHYNTIFCAKLEEREQLREKWREIRRLKAAKIDYEARNLQPPPQRKHRRGTVIKPPRVTNRMREERAKEREEERKMRLERENAIFDEATEHNKWEQAKVDSIAATLEMTPIAHAQFWDTLCKELSYETKNPTGQILHCLKQWCDVKSEPGCCRAFFVDPGGIPDMPFEGALELVTNYAMSLLESTRPAHAVACEIAFLSQAKRFPAALVYAVAEIAIRTGRLKGILQGEESIWWFSPVLYALEMVPFEYLCKILDQVVRTTTQNSRMEKCKLIDAREVSDFFKQIWRSSFAFVRMQRLLTIELLIRSGNAEGARIAFPAVRSALTAIPLPRLRDGVSVQYMEVLFYEKELNKAKETIWRYQKDGRLPK